MEKVLLSIQVAPDTRQRLKVLAAQRGVSVRELLEPALNKIILSADERPCTAPTLTPSSE